VAYAGDEFVVVLPGRDQPQAMQKASAICSTVKNTAYVLDKGVEVRLQASFGVATFPQDATDLNGLIAAADHALFAIKKSGKNAVGGFNSNSGTRLILKGRLKPIVTVNKPAEGAQNGAFAPAAAALGAAWSMRPASRENGRDWSHILPGPWRVAKKSPSPPNRAVLTLPACGYRI
jgi:hypothetical protein